MKYVAALLLSRWLNEAGGIELKCHARLNPEAIKDAQGWVPQVPRIPGTSLTDGKGGKKTLVKAG